MAVGTNSFLGLAVPLNGESEIAQQTAATDILTITGAASQTGDFIVMRNSTGTENFVVSSSGLVTSAAGASFSGVVAFTGAVTNTSTYTATLSSSGANAIIVSVTSTGAIAAGAITSNAFIVQASSKSVLNSVLAYYSGAGSEVGSCNNFLAVYGSKAPTYFVAVGATVAGVGAQTDNGFLETSVVFNAAPSTLHVFYGLHMLAGSYSAYVLVAPSSLVTIS